MPDVDVVLKLYSTESVYMNTVIMQDSFQLIFSPFSGKDASAIVGKIQIHCPRQPTLLIRHSHRPLQWMPVEAAATR